jgi:Lon protease-like protein
MPFSKPFALNDCGWVANRWSELLPLPPGQKEHLLGLDNPRLRLDLVSELLQEMGIMQDE